MDEEPSRLDTELDLLHAMYPDQIAFVEKSRELKFSQDSSSLLLRLPATYPVSGSPDVISATDSSKTDIRDKIRRSVKELALEDGVEALDAIIAAFLQILENDNAEAVPSAKGDANDAAESQEHKTVVIWLHHLLNTNKRKLALSPAASVNGLTKPGYPGILVFSGPSSAVSEHVSTLKAQNWQAFQVRYEENESWSFSHGKGVNEVETMAEVVKSVELVDGDSAGISKQGIDQKEELLKAIGIK